MIFSVAAVVAVVICFCKIVDFYKAAEQVQKDTSSIENGNLPFCSTSELSVSLPPPHCAAFPACPRFA